MKQYARFWTFEKGRVFKRKGYVAVPSQFPSGTEPYYRPRVLPLLEQIQVNEQVRYALIYVKLPYTLNARTPKFSTKHAKLLWCGHEGEHGAEDREFHALLVLDNDSQVTVFDCKGESWLLTSQNGRVKVENCRKKTRQAKIRISTWT